MDWFLISYHSIGVFVGLITIFIMAMFLLFKKDKTTPTRWLFVMYFGFEIMLLGYFLAYTVYNPLGAYHRYVTLFALLGNIGFTGFAYYFPKNDQPKESITAIIITAILAISAYIHFIIKTIKMEKFYNFTAHHYNVDFGSEAALVLILSQLWPVITLGRKSAKYSKEADPSYSKALKGNAFIRKIKSFFLGWKYFFKPVGKDAIACASFSKALMLLLVIALSNALNKVGILPFDLYALIYSNFTLIICFSSIIIYLNNSPEPTTFMIKLVGISLVTVNMVLGFVGNLTLGISERSYDSIIVAELKSTQEKIISGDFSSIPDNIEYIISHNKDEDPFDPHYNILYKKSGNDLTIEALERSEIQFKKQLLRNLYNKLEKKNKSLSESELLKLASEEYKNEKAYSRFKEEYDSPYNRGYRDGNKLYTHFDFYNGDTRFEAGFDYYQYRLSIHNDAVKLVYIIIGTTLIIIIIFPMFFQSSLVRPLNHLLRGVVKVNKGDLSAEVPIKVHDEIGIIATSFNSMVASIRQARKELQDYAENLEEKVEERTKEVQNKMEEVQKLKVQQDGDYFLTSLLAKPLFYNANRSEILKTDFLIHQKKQFEFRNRKADLGGDICITGNLKLGTPSSHKRYVMALNGDAMGKSMQGAGGCLVMGVVMNSIMARSAANKKVLNVTPEQWLTDVYAEVNSVFKSFNGSMVLSATIILINEETGMMHYFNAEHPFSVLYRDNKASFIESSMQLRKLGLDSEFEFKVFSFQLLPGDIVVLASDGRDDIDLTPEEPVRTINEDETLFLRIVEESNADMHEMEKNIMKKGNITDDLSFLTVSFDSNAVINNMKEIIESVKEKKLLQTESIEEKIESNKSEELIQEENAEPAEQSLNEFENPYFIPVTSNIDINHMYMESKKLYQEGNLNKAIEVLSTAFRVDQNNQKLNKLLGLLSLKGKDYETAVKVLNKYLNEDPDTEEVLYYLSIAQKKIGNYLDSMNSAKKVYEIDPSNINNIIHLADLFRLEGNMENAKELLEKALSLEPKNKNVLKLKELIEKKSE